MKKSKFRRRPNFREPNSGKSWLGGFFRPQKYSAVKRLTRKEIDELYGSTPKGT